MRLGVEQLRPGATNRITVLGILAKNKTVDAAKFQSSEGNVV